MFVPVRELVRRAAAMSPDAPAVDAEPDALTYAELEARAGRFAVALADRIHPGDLVAVLLPRSPDAIAAMLAILDVGAAFVPLDTAYPASRLSLILAESGASLLVTSAAYGAGVEVPTERLLVEEIAAAPERRAVAPARVGPEDVAYVVFTSGSTGRPKGVVVPQRGLPNLVAAQADGFRIGRGTRVAHVAPLGFDAAVSEILVTLAAGGTLVVAGPGTAMSGKGLGDFLSRGRVEVATLVPSTLASLPQRELPALRTLVVAGEVSPDALLAFWGRGRRLVNAYGPSEATVCATMAVCGDPPAGRVIGRALPNVTVELVDERHLPVNDGVVGEIAIGGVGLALGYLGQPELTAERFVHTSRGRLYLTGDLARRLPDGSLEFRGRVDGQVKVRGSRVELGEIEHALAGLDGLKDAAVTLDAHGRLVAYVVADDPAPSAGEVAQALAARLPTYMLPSRYLQVADLPLSAHGKRDRSTLPDPDSTSSLPDDREHRPPRTPTERAVAAIWSELLGGVSPAAEDNLFAHGADSLLAADAMARIKVELGADLPLHAALAHPTIAAIAERVDALVATPRAIQLTRVDRHIEPISDDQGPTFQLSDEQRAWRTRAHAFAAETLRPLGAEADASGMPPRELARAAAESGLLAPTLPARWGGGGVDALTGVVIAEELAWGCAGLSASLQPTLFVGEALLRFGTDEQRGTYLPRLAGRAGGYAAIAFTESSAGSDFAAMQTFARRDGGDYVLYGEKAFITNGGVADLMLVFARTDEGLTAFLLKATDRGISSEPVRGKLGWRGSHTGSIVLDGVRVPERRRIGEHGAGSTIALALWATARPQVAAQALGVTRAAFEYATAFARERHAFGSAIIDHQGISFKLAQIAMELEAGRLLTWRAAASTADDDPLLLAAYAKAFAADLAMRATTDAVQILGAAGITNSHPVEKWMRDAKVFQIVEGTSEIQRHVVYSYLKRTGFATEPAVRSPRVPARRSHTFPTSPRQELWARLRADGPHPFFNVQAPLHLRGPLDVPSLQRALNELVRRHEALRTTLLVEADHVRARVWPPFDVELIEEHLDHIEHPDARLVEARRRTAADATSPLPFPDGPLFRARLLVLGDREHVLLMTADHTVCDGVSIELVVRELEHLYASYAAGEQPTLAEPEVQFGDYVTWMQQRIAEGDLDAGFEFWASQLAHLSNQRTFPAAVGGPMHETRFVRDPGVSWRGELDAAVRRCAAGLGATPFSVCGAAVVAMLWALEPRPHIALRVTHSNRNDPATRGIVGMLSDDIVVVVFTGDDPTFGTLVERFASAYAAAVEHSEMLAWLPRHPRYEQRRIVLERRYAVDAWLNFVHSGSREPTRPGPVEFHRLEGPLPAVTLDLPWWDGIAFHLVLADISGTLHDLVGYNAHLLSPTRAAELRRLLQEALLEGTTAPGRGLDSLASALTASADTIALGATAHTDEYDLV